jgi:hypothetical protein
MSGRSEERKWPAVPYKGLRFYGEEDVPLFAGRDEDIDSVCELIGLGNIRILLLHGMTGCGKSSFLRAGLIPALEEEIAGYEFLREESGKPDFVRSTDDPVTSLARQVFRFVNRNNQVVKHSEDTRPGHDASNAQFRSSRIGRRSKALVIPTHAELTEEEFLHLVASDPNELAELIEQITSQIPRTFVLVIDQAEEVITVKPGEGGDAARIRFFDFLSDVSQSRFDLKLIICFRTEYHGQFYAKLRYGADVSRINDYYLSDLNEEQIVDAILRPTVDVPLPGYGSARDAYHFKYEDGLPKTIATALLSSGLSGGVLPALQLVCRRLYEGLRSKPQEPTLEDGGSRTLKGRPQRSFHEAEQTPSPRSILEIKSSAFSTVGGLAGQVISFLQSELEAALTQEFAARRNAPNLFSEVDRWRKVLTSLVKMQVNGSTTTDIIPVEILWQRAKEMGCHSDPRFMFAFLSNEHCRIVRLVEVARLNTKEVIRCYSLGHDVLAGALEEWNKRDERERFGNGITFRASNVNSNQVGKHYALNLITPMKPWKSPILKTILFLLDKVKPLQSDFADQSFVYFASWYLVKRKKFPRLSSEQSEERLSFDYLIFICGLNGAWSHYIDSFAAVFSKGVDMIYRWSEHYPGCEKLTPFKQYLTDVKFRTDYLFVAYPGATMGDVASAHRVESSFRKFERISDALSNAEFEAAYTRFVVNVQTDLGRTD